MIQPHSNLPSMNKRVVNTFYDAHGNVILELGATECIIQDADGSLTKLRINENVQLACGTMFNAAMAMGPNPAVVLAVCGVCRRPCSAEAGGTCVGCGVSLCPRHGRRNPDGKWRCAVCDCKRAVKAGLERLFFHLEGE